MKKAIQIIVMMLAGAVLALVLRQCTATGGSDAKGSAADTVVYVDTVVYKAPAATRRDTVGSVRVRVERTEAKASGQDQIKSGVWSVESGEDLEGRVKGDELRGTRDEEQVESREGRVERDESGDTIELPVVQSVYEDSTYKAYVSGVYARLDSIYVYPKREVITIKQPPNRWHIGISAGCAITGRGIQPYIGVGITYSIISF